MPHDPPDAKGHTHGHDHAHPHHHHHPHETEEIVGATHAGARPLAHGEGAGKLLHLDCFSGIAGDMLVAALLDLGVPMEALRLSLDALPLTGYAVSTTLRAVHGIVATRFVVTVEAGQPQRRYRDIRALLDAAPLAEGVRTRAQRAFRALAEAEGRVHRIDPETVHFHEVGAVDAIVDIVAASAALEWIGARVNTAPVPMSHGFVRAAHGVLPVPAPAVVEVLAGVPTYGVDVAAEIVTPTGACLVRANATGFDRWPAMRPIATGFGAGTRILPNQRPNLLRVVLGEPTAEATDKPGEGTHAVLETNLDDSTGQVVAHVTESLLREGALDAWTTPIGMKKGRPGLLVSALVRAPDRERVGRVMLRESNSLGVRSHPVSRVERPRRIETVETEFGSVPVKIADGDGIAPSAQPEYEVCRALAAQRGVPVRVVQQAALAAWWGRSP